MDDMRSNHVSLEYLWFSSKRFKPETVIYGLPVSESLAGTFMLKARAGYHSFENSGSLLFPLEKKPGFEFNEMSDGYFSYGVAGGGVAVWMPLWVFYLSSRLDLSFGSGYYTITPGIDRGYPFVVQVSFFLNAGIDLNETFFGYSILSDSTIIRLDDIDVDFNTIETKVYGGYRF